jgi:hypothetical protein
MRTVTIHGERSRGLSLAIPGYAFPDATTDWDRDWLDCRAEADTGVFRVVVKSALRIQGDGLGHVVAHVEIVDGSEEASSLEYCVRLDQTYLPPIIRDLEAVWDAFPVGGR